MEYKRLFIVMLIVLAADQLSKILIRAFLPMGQKLWLIKPVLSFTHTTNTGAAFGLLKDGNLMLIWVSLIAFGLMLYYYDRFEEKMRIYVALISGAILGNLADRVFLGHVTDFIDFQMWPVFNIADSCLVISVAMLVIYTLKN
ncbi:MAG: signal peptidase II [Nanoarchaeota archaeon]|nr:signal peptidase II [Nanoarchaeota archaeon]